jgi:hypothetical protein
MLQRLLVWVVACVVAVLVCLLDNCCEATGGKDDAPSTSAQSVDVLWLCNVQADDPAATIAQLGDATGKLGDYQLTTSPHTTDPYILVTKTNGPNTVIADDPSTTKIVLMELMRLHKLRDSTPGPIVHVTGPSGSGKSTLLAAVLAQSNVQRAIGNGATVTDFGTLVDVDSFDDESAIAAAVEQDSVARSVRRLQLNIEAISEILAAGTPPFYFVGVPVPLTSLCTVHWALDCSAVDNYRQLTRRTVDAICEHKQEFYEKIADAATIDQLEDTMQRWTTDHKIRNEGVLRPEQVANAVARFKRDHLAIGYAFWQPAVLVSMITQKRGKAR